MRGFLSIWMLVSAIPAVVFADLPVPKSKPGQEGVPNPPDDIPPYDDQPHPEKRAPKPFPDEQPSIDPPSYPGTRAPKPFPDEQPSIDAPPYLGASPSDLHPDFSGLDDSHLRLRRSPEDDKSKSTVNDDKDDDSKPSSSPSKTGIDLINDGIRVPKPETQYGFKNYLFPWN